MAKKNPTTLMALADQRLRFFLKYRQLILFNRISGQNFSLESKVILQDDDDTRKKALVWLDTGAQKIKIDETTSGIPSGYLPAIELSFDDAENSFWNDNFGGTPGIVVGTGDLRNLTPDDDLDNYLLTLALPELKTSAIIFEFIDEFRINLYAKTAPSFK